MPLYQQFDLTHQYISQSYVRILQITSGGMVLDGLGNTIEFTSSYSLFSSASIYAESASYAVSSSHITEYTLSSSYADTASYASTANHNSLYSLDYLSSGHTEFAGTNVTNYFTQNQVITGSLNIVGHLFATQKSFYIDNKDIPGKHLIYGALEGPQNDVFIRGRVQKKSTSVKISLPSEWIWLVDENTITVQLTQREFYQNLLVTNVKNNCVSIKNISTSKKSKKELNFDYIIIGERKDVERLQVRD